MVPDERSYLLYILVLIVIIDFFTFKIFKDFLIRERTSETADTKLQIRHVRDN